jgi:hypothetical protein
VANAASFGNFLPLPFTVARQSHNPWREPGIGQGQVFTLLDVYPTQCHSKVRTLNAKSLAHAAGYDRVATQLYSAEAGSFGHGMNIKKASVLPEALQCQVFSCRTAFSSNPTRLNQTLFHRPNGSFGSVARFELAEDVLHVFLHRFDADFQRFADFAVAEAEGYVS